ncbi:hypothetical protein Bca101_057551 [Brassica carinata]
MRNSFSLTNGRTTLNVDWMQAEVEIALVALCRSVQDIFKLLWDSFFVQDCCGTHGSEDYGNHGIHPLGAWKF